MGERFRRFMQGRYGVDQLSHFLLFLTLFLMLIRSFLRRGVFSSVLCGLAMLFLICSYYRILSKNHYQRYRENEWYLQYSNRVKYFYDRGKIRLRERKTHKIFRCPDCGQNIRVPRGKGKIAITCPVCKTEFIRKS